MLTVFVFDERESGREEDLRAALDRLADDALLWIALLDPSEEEVAAVQEALELSDEQAAGCSSSRADRHCLTQASTCMRRCTRPAARTVNLSSVPSSA